MRARPAPPAWPPSGRARTRARPCGTRWRARRYSPRPARGSRVRVFGGWDFAKDDLDRSDFAKYGYENGVPMGGDLKAAPAGKAPTFLIRALRDVDGANLDRIQIVKGWLGKDGQDAGESLRRRVVGQTASRARTASCRRSATPSMSSEATYTNAIGAVSSGSVSGKIRSSMPASAPSTTCACSRSPHRAGRPSTPRSSA